MFDNQTTKQLQMEQRSLRIHRDRLVNTGTIPPRSLDSHMSRVDRELQRRG